MRWKAPLNAFAFTFQDRWLAAETYLVKTAGDAANEIVSVASVVEDHYPHFGG